MQFSASSSLLLVALAAHVAAHGVVTSITGSNNVTMPGLSVIDGTPRDCSTPGCGAEEDTSIIRDDTGPLGKTNGGGDVNPETVVAAFMGGSAGAATRRVRRGLLDGLLGGLNGNNNNNNGGDSSSSGATDAEGTQTPDGTVEDGISKATGEGAKSGLPTVGSDGVINLNFHQVNQDGAGPLAASVDPTSGGTDENSFQSAQMLVDVPGLPVGGLSTAKTTDFPIKIQMPAGMKCTGTVAGVKNVCVVRVKNQALAGPFGGSAVFTQEGAAGGAAGAGAAASSPAATPASTPTPGAQAAAARSGRGAVGGATGQAARARRFAA